MEAEPSKPFSGLSAEQLEMLRTEFEANWEYIRHIEELRTKLVELFLIVYGAVLAVLAFLAGGLKRENEPLTVEFIIQQFGPVVLGLFLFLFLFGLALTAFQARQKRSHEHYRAVNAGIRSLFGVEICGALGFETTARRDLMAKSLRRSPFFWWLVSLAGLNSSALFFFVVSFLVFQGLHQSQATQWSLVVSAAGWIFQAFMYWQISGRERTHSLFVGLLSGPGG